MGPFVKFCFVNIKFFGVLWTFKIYRDGIFHVFATSCHAKPPQWCMGFFTFDSLKCASVRWQRSLVGGVAIIAKYFLQTVSTARYSPSGVSLTTMHTLFEPLWIRCIKPIWGVSQSSSISVGVPLRRAWLLEITLYIIRGAYCTFSTTNFGVSLLTVVWIRTVTIYCSRICSLFWDLYSRRYFLSASNSALILHTWLVQAKSIIQFSEPFLCDTEALYFPNNGR